MKYCLNCGYETNKKTKNCPQCGEENSMKEFEITNDDIINYTQNE